LEDEGAFVGVFDAETVKVKGMKYIKILAK